MIFNNITTYPQLTIPQCGINYSIGCGLQGSSVIFPSNWVHNRKRLRRLYVPSNTKFYFITRTEINRGTE